MCQLILQNRQILLEKKTTGPINCKLHLFTTVKLFSWIYSLWLLFTLTKRVFLLPLQQPWYTPSLSNWLCWVKCKCVTVILVTNTLLFPPQRKVLIGTSLIVAVSLFVVVANYSEKPYFPLQPMFRQGFSSRWMFSKQSYKDLKPHLGYVSIPKQEVSSSFLYLQTKPMSESPCLSFF